MTSAAQQLLQEARQYVTGIFTNKVNPAFVYHNIEHTREVVEAADQMASYLSLPEEERPALLLAAWFHDTGYSAGQPKRHEEVSRDIAADFLRNKGVDQETIDRVSNAIMATKWPQSPTDLLEQILCDADLSHLGMPVFPEKNKLLRQELNLLFDNKLSKKEWRQKNIFFLQQHRYFTEYGKTVLEPVKQHHLQALILKADKNGKEEEGSFGQMIVDTKLPDTNITMPEKTNGEKAIRDKEREKLEKDKAARTERSISTMFRIMSENHVNLSQMADSKANIMISVNTIVISIMVSVLLGKLQFYPEFIVPTIILLTVCTSAVVFAILATRPNVNRGVFTKEDIENKKVNLLFFGNFFNMELKDYDWAMKQMMADRDYLDSSMIKDIYSLGVVLARKYKYLRIAYNIFMFGLVIAIIAFAIVFLFSEQNPNAA
ncbi:MAG: HD domain-containing protein [Chitinophagaceae bacterium]|nr:HD domain-containing protein [Chitinophagaceae bacterium]